LLITASTFAQAIQEKHQRAKILYSEQSDLSRLETLGLPVDHGKQKLGYYIISDFSENELDIARANGFQVVILIEDTTQFFLDRNAQRLPSRNLTCAESAIDYETPANFNLGSMGGFLTYQEMLDELDQMRALYPNLISAKSNISTFITEGAPDDGVSPSIGGNGIQWVRISDNPDVEETEPQILYSAIHHAREPQSLSQLIFYMWYLLENYDTDPEVQAIVNNSELYFIPVLNPDGYLYNELTDPNGGGFWRKNRKANPFNTFGVDNNRNYQYFINGDPSDGMWGGDGSSGSFDSQTYRGTAPFSEVENQAMKWFVENHNFTMAFNNHSFGNLLLRPFGYAENTPSAEEDLFRILGDELVSKNGFNNILSSELYAAAGDSDDFMYGTVGTHDPIYAYTPEIGPEFWPPSSEIINISKGMVFFNLTSSKMINNYATAEDTGSLFVGEDAELTAAFDLKRLGLAGNGDFTVTLEAVTANIAIVGSSQSFSGLNILETQSGSLTYTLSGGTTAGDAIIYDLTVNNGVFDTKIRVRKLFGALTTVFEDTADSVTDNYDNNGFSTTGNTFVSPSTSITDSPGGNYQNNADKSIELTETIDLTTAAGANVSFYAKWEIESAFDYAQFQISIDNGASWIAQCGKYTGPGSTNNSQPTGEPLYDGAQLDWVLEEIDLSDYLGETIKARFVFLSDGGLRQDGFYFDDLTFSIVEDAVLDIDAVAKTQFTLYPNPVSELLTIKSSLKNYTLSLFSIQGQLIEKRENLNAQEQFNYSNLASGLYILKLTTENSTETIKIIKQ
jgi:hypothetical protein